MPVACTDEGAFHRKCRAASGRERASRLLPRARLAIVRLASRYVVRCLFRPHVGRKLTAPLSLVSSERNAPRAEVVSTMARLITDLPPKLLTMDKSFDRLLRLLQDPLLAVQISSYDLLRRVVRKHVEDLVVEVELDTEEKIEIGLPSALVKVLETRLDGDNLLPEEVCHFFRPPRCCARR